MSESPVFTVFVVLDNNQYPRLDGIVFGKHKAEKRQIAARLRRNMTPAEERLWVYLRAGRLGGIRFRRRQIIDGFIVDFFCFSAALIIEIDGSSHDGKEQADRDRTSVFGLRVLHVIRFSNDRVTKDLTGVLAEILQLARKRQEQMADRLACD